MILEIKHLIILQSLIYTYDNLDRFGVLSNHDETL